MYADSELSNGQWEICRITYETVRETKGLFTKETVVFVALASGPQGEYRAAKSKSFSLGAFNVYGPTEKDKKHQEAFAGLVAKLEADGWKRVTEQAQPWFNVEFRRRIAGTNR